MTPAEQIQAVWEKTTKGHWASPAANVFRLFSWDPETQTPTRVIIDDAAVESCFWGKIDAGWGDPATFDDETCDRLGCEATGNVEFCALAHNHWPAVYASLAAVTKERDEAIAERDALRKLVKRMAAAQGWPGDSEGWTELWADIRRAAKETT